MAYIVYDDDADDKAVFFLFCLPIVFLDVQGYCAWNNNQVKHNRNPVIAGDSNISRYVQ